MKFVDAHIHLSDSAYDGKIPQILQEAKQTNVVAMISNSMNLDTSRFSLRLAEEHQGMVYAALGIHPWNTSQMRPDELERTVEFIQQNASNNKRVVAIGEVGLDPQYAKRKEQKALQAEVFHEMLRLAEKLTLPVIVHSRWSAEKILNILVSYRLRTVLWHWFSGPTDLLPKIIERGDYISEGPPTVFSTRIQEIIRLIPLERLLTETDGPVRYYGPFKDKFTTPAFIPEVVKTIGEIKGVKESEATEQIYHNFVNFTQIGL